MQISIGGFLIDARESVGTLDQNGNEISSLERAVVLRFQLDDRASAALKAITRVNASTGGVGDEAIFSDFPGSELTERQEELDTQREYMAHIEENPALASFFNETTYRRNFLQVLRGNSEFQNIAFRI